MSQAKPKFSAEEKAILAAAPVVNLLTLDAVLSSINESEKANILKQMRQSAEFGSTIVASNTIVTITGPSTMRDERTLQFPVVYGGQRANRMWTHWFFAQLSICDDPSMITKAANKKVWAKAAWLSASESLGSLIVQFKCVGFEKKKDSAGRPVLPPHTFDTDKVQKLLDETEFGLFVKQYDDFDDDNLPDEHKGQRGRMKRASLINKIRSQNPYSAYLEDQFLIPGRAKDRELNSKGESFVQGTVRIDPFFTKEQLDIVNK